MTTQRRTRGKLAGLSDVLVAVAIVGGLVLLDVLALRFGHDSRDGLRPDPPVTR